MFAVWYDAAIFANALGHPLQVKQVNHALSRRGTIRGIHFAQVPPGQAKYVYCPQVRYSISLSISGSGRRRSASGETVVLDAVSYRATYLAEGLGHAYIAQADDSVLVYLCSERYNPAREFGVNPSMPISGCRGLPICRTSCRTGTARHPAGAGARRRTAPRYDECERYYRALCQNDR
jgi:dTDP-4-dehydrorhamnose 3,5-epimerase